MNKKVSCLYMSKEQFASAYLSLETFYSIYNDGADVAATMLKILNSVYLEEHRSVLDHKSALEIMKSNHNERGAGRKAKITEEIKQEIRKMKSEGMSVSKIATEFDISIRSVYLICE